VTANEWYGLPRSGQAADVPNWTFTSVPTSERSSQMKITTIGIDLAKQSYSVHGVDANGKSR